MPTPLVWDAPDKRFFERGVNKGVLYTPTAGVYSSGVAWNGLTGVTKSPSGAEPNKQYADNIMYVALMSLEEFNATIEAFTFPDEFLQFDGVRKTANGMQVGQQTRPFFGFSWVTLKGNGVNEDLGYVVHLAYGLKAGVAEKAFVTVNDSPEAMTFSWGVWSTPVSVTGFPKPVATIDIDSTDSTVKPTGLSALESALYGKGATPARLPLPDEVDTLLATAV